MLTEDQITANRQRFESLLHSVNRDGMQNVISFLEGNDFYHLPSSLGRHHNWEGGLVQHCLGVFDRLSKTGESLPEESVVITSLLHDICKAGKIYRNDRGEWCERKDGELEIPGHGDRSVKILQQCCGLELTPEEKDAIRWHMGGYNIPKEEMRDFFANKKSDLRRLLLNADRYDASHNGD